MPLVPKNAIFALKILLPRTKIDKVHATNVLPAVPPNQAAPSVPIARRANLKMMSMVLKCAPNAPVGMHKVKQTNHIVLSARRKKKHQQLVPVLVRIVMWANSIQMLVTIVRRAPPANTKTVKVKRRAVKFVPRLEKNPTVKAPGVNCHRGVPAKWANI